MFRRLKTKRLLPEKKFFWFCALSSLGEVWLRYYINESLPPQAAQSCDPRFDYMPENPPFAPPPESTLSYTSLYFIDLLMAVWRIHGSISELGKAWASDFGSCLNVLDSRMTRCFMLCYRIHDHSLEVRA